MNKFYVYLLLSLKDKRTYLGSTIVLENRLKEHNRGKAKSTKYRRPLKLIYYESYNTLKEAREREKFLKTKKGRKELAEIFKKIKL